MKTVAVNLQDENREDDGEAHDPFVAIIDDADFAALQAADGCNPIPDEDPVIERLRAGRVEAAAFPVPIDACFAIWTCF